MNRTRPTHQKQNTKNWSTLGRWPPLSYRPGTGWLAMKLRVVQCPALSPVVGSPSQLTLVVMRAHACALPPLLCLCLLRVPARHRRRSCTYHTLCCQHPWVPSGGLAIEHAAALLVLCLSFTWAAFILSHKLFGIGSRAVQGGRL